MSQPCFAAVESSSPRWDDNDRTRLKFLHSDAMSGRGSVLRASCHRCVPGRPNGSTVKVVARLRPWITSLPRDWETSAGTHGAAVAVSCHARNERFFTVSSRWGDVAGGWEMDRGGSEGRSQGSGDSGEVEAD